jgi:hypothetical protein
LTVQTTLGKEEPKGSARLPVKRNYDSPELLKADELFGRKRTESGAGNYTAAELRKAIQALESKRKAKKIVVEEPIIQPATGPA